MNPFLNPLFVSRILKFYFTEVDRLRRLNASSLKRFQDRQLKALVKYAYSVPFFHEKCEKIGVKPQDVHGIDDINKLPIMNKDDLRNINPENLIPPDTNKERMIKSYTSGTTGKAVSIFIDMYTIVAGLFGYIRVLREHDIDWKRTRMTVIADLSEHSAETEYLTDGVIPKIKRLFPLDNMQILHTYDDPNKLIHKISDFNPEFVGGYPGMLRQLAILKNRGLGKNIEPRCILSTGSVLGDHIRIQIETSFNAPMFDTYGAMESGPMAFQCKKRRFHIHSDLVYLEFVNDDGEPVNPDEPSHVLLTRLYGKGTPIIRYSGLDDIVTPSFEQCSCGIVSGYISKIHGRESHSIILPDGIVIMPSTLDKYLGDFNQSYNIDCVDRFQIIQHKLDEISILVVINKDLKKSISVKQLFSRIKQHFQQKFGLDVKLHVEEIKKIKPHDAGIVSKVNREKIKKKIYL